MIRHFTLIAATLLVGAEAAEAQAVAKIIDQTGQPRTAVYSLLGGGMSAMAGLAVSSATTARDTLGILITSVSPGSAAEKAGLQEGNRIAAINGVNLKLHPADAGQFDMQGIMAKRFQREMARVRPGDSVKLSIYADARFKDVTIKTEAPEERMRRLTPEPVDANRATIGAIVGGTPSKRDTLGVLVTEIAEDGPLGKNKLYEGIRIAAIAGVDLRVPVSAAGDAKAATEKVDLLIAELGKVTAGSRVELRVYEAGQFRNVTVETMRRGDVKMPSTLAVPAIIRSGGNMLPLNELRIIDENVMRIRPQLDSALQRLRLHVPRGSRVIEMKPTRVERMQRESSVRPTAYPAERHALHVLHK